jgi:hypothetical protein
LLSHDSRQRGGLSFKLLLLGREVFSACLSLLHRQAQVVGLVGVEVIE